MKTFFKFVILLTLLFIGYKLVIKIVERNSMTFMDVNNGVNGKVDKIVETGINFFEEKMGNPNITSEKTAIVAQESVEIKVPESTDTLYLASSIDYYALTMANYESVRSSRHLKNRDSVFMQQFADKEVYRRGRIVLAPDIINRFRIFVGYIKSHFPGVKIVVTSGVRTRGENEILENASVLSHHLTGDALDFCITGPGISKKEIGKICRDYFDIVLDDYKDSHIHVAMRR